MSQVIELSSLRKVYEVHERDPGLRGALRGYHELNAKAVVLSCSAVETARLLLISDVANSSGQVGKNLTSHFGVTVRGFLPSI